MPLATASPDAAKDRANANALSAPPALGARLPTTATEGCQSSAASPATNSISGGEAMRRNSAG